MTYALDTSVVLRLMVDDVPDQRALAVQLLALEDEVVVPDAAIIETTFALDHHYRRSRPDIAEMWRLFQTLPGVALSHATLASALAAWTRHPKLSFTDCWMAAECTAAGQVLATFDRKLANQLSATELLGSRSPSAV